MLFRSDEVRYGDPDPRVMCGDGRVEVLEDAPDSLPFRAKYVQFINGAHTKWHYHTGEQLLVGMAGTGFVEFHNSPAITLRVGDRAFIPAGVWHRHGAMERGSRVHLAITTGKIIWDQDDRCAEDPPGSWKEREA